jgi:hypothetical protein
MRAHSEVWRLCTSSWANTVKKQESHPGGGVHKEGEDIEILEVDLKQAVKWVENRHIRDGRSIILLLHLYLQEAVSMIC